MKTPRSQGRILPGIVLLLLAGFASQGQNGVPRPDHVVVVIEENHAFGDIIKPSGPGYINSLAREGALFIESYAVTHPSEPNYLALFSGSTHGVTGDICSGAYGTPNLGSELLGAGLTFGGYSESLPHVGFTGCESGHYKRKHNPWVNFTNVPSALNMPLVLFPTNFNDLPALSFVVPNQANDMHSGSVGQADGWLRGHLDRYVQWARTNNSLLILTWDEDDHSEDNRIATIFVGPMVRPGKYCERITHYTVLRTLLDMYGLTPMAHATNAIPITSCWMPGTALSAVTLDLTSPHDGEAFLAGESVEFMADAASASGLVSRVEFFNGTKKLGEATNSPFQMVWSNATPGAHCVLARATDDMGRTKTSASIMVRVLPQDLLPPTATILSPRPNARVLDAMLAVRATAADNVGVAAMAYRVAPAPFQTVPGLSNLTVAVPLEPGTNRIEVKSIDFYNHESPVAAVKVFYVTTSMLALARSGAGTVTPDLDGRTLEVGRGYTVTAKPSAGNLFSHWSGDVAGGSARLVFLMQSNLMLQANFVTNPFLAVRGAYAGLFHEPTEVRHESSGWFSLVLADRGTFSARVLSAGRRLSFSGAFDLDGRATNVVKRPGTNALTFELALDLHGGSGQVTGRVTSAQWDAAVLGDRDVFDGRTSRAPFATNYTLVASGDPGSELLPGGDGFGAARVTAAGAVTFSGTLADGTRVTQGTTVSMNGFWPFYAPLYGGRGSVLSWVNFAGTPTNDLSGRMSWFKPPSPTDRFYPAGFALDTVLDGSIYTRPGVGRALDQTNGAVTFSGGGLAASFTNFVTLGPGNKVVNESSNKLSLTVVTSSGLFSGSVTLPDGGTALTFKGALLQKRNSATGYFPGPHQSGRVSWEPSTSNAGRTLEP